MRRWRFSRRCLNTGRNWWVNFWGFPNNPFRNSENFGFSKAVPMRLFVPKPTREESAFPLSTLLAFFTARFACYNVSGALATGWKSCRCAVPSLGPEALVFRPLRSARFLNRPHVLKFKNREVLSFRNVDWRAQKWHRMNGSRPMARSLKFGNRVAMTFCATH